MLSSSAAPDVKCKAREEGMRYASSASKNDIARERLKMMVSIRKLLINICKQPSTFASDIETLSDDKISPT